MTARHDVERVVNALIPCDGYELAADLYLPRGAAPAPALITLLPYNKDWVASGDAWSTMHELAACGFPTMLADFRGTGGSGGVARPPFDPGEADDGVALVEWAAAQPWCDGNVGMWGVSYGGITALRTASRRPPALKAIVPIVGQVDPERDFINPSGIRGMVSPLSWALQNMLMQLTPPLCRDDEGRWRRVWRQRLEHAEPYLQDIVSFAPGDERWRERAIDVERIEAATLCVTGWRDLVADAMVEAYERVRAPKRLIAGPWMHVFPSDDGTHAVDFVATLVRWFDRWLRGVDNGADREPAATVFTLGREAWATFDAWPGDEQERLGLALAADGALGGAVAGEVSTVADATVGAHMGLAWYPSAGYGPPDDQHADDRRALAFTSAPLEQPLELLGRPRARLALARAPERPAPLVVKLADVHPDGRSHPIVTGAALADGERVEVELAATSYEVAAGHRLRVTVATGDFPRLWPDAGVAPLTVVCDPARGASDVLLPLAPADGRAPLDWPTVEPRRPPLVVGTPSVRYEVARELSADRARVAIELELTMRMPNADGTVTFRHDVRAEVAADRPGEARFTGASSARGTIDGDSFDVRVELTVDGHGAIATGTAALGSEQPVERRWETPAATAAGTTASA